MLRITPKLASYVVQNNRKWNLRVDNIFEKSSKRLYMQRLLKRSKADRKTLIVVPTVLAR